MINDNELFKKVNNNWEFRTLYNKTDKTETVVISTHGIEKKSTKTAPKEMKKQSERKKKKNN